MHGDAPAVRGKLTRERVDCSDPPVAKRCQTSSLSAAKPRQTSPTPANPRLKYHTFCTYSLSVKEALKSMVFVRRFATIRFRVFYATNGRAARASRS